MPIPRAIPAISPTTPRFFKGFQALSSLFNSHQPSAISFYSRWGRIQVYDVPSADTVFTQLVVKVRKEHGLKLPDAIIAGTAIAKGLIILTADDHFKKSKASWRTHFFAVDAGI